MTAFDGGLIADLSAETHDPKFTELGTDLGTELTLWLPAAATEPPSAELRAAAEEFERFCADHGAGVPTAVAHVPSATSGAESLDKAAVASAIRGRLEQVIVDRGLPYVVTQAEFQEAGPEAAAVHRPEGTLWVVQFEDPISAAEVSYKTLFYDPLEAYSESLRPEFESGVLDEVVLYIISWQDQGQTVYEITPELMDLFLRGEITVKELTDKMVITGM
jgi:hypothetical protein